MKPALGLTGFVFVLLSFSSCGGQSVSRDGDRDETSGASSDDSDTGGRGGTSSGRGGASAATGGTGAATGGTTAAGMGGTSLGTGGSAGSAGSGTAGSGGCAQTIVASIANNYSLSSGLVFPPVSVRPDSELRFRWSGVTEDLLGHELDPRLDVDAVHLMLWKASPDNFQAMVHDDALRQRDLAVIMNVYTGQMLTETSLFEFTSLGMPVPPEDILPFFNADSYPPAQHVYTLMIATGQELGKGTRMIQSFTLDPASTNTLVEMTNDSTLVQYTADFAARERTLVAPGTNDITIDWTNLTVNARRQAFSPYDITEVVVARYDETVSELENQFLDLELIAEEMWRGYVESGTTASFSTLTDVDGRPFPGVSSDGTWIVALRCGRCLSPAPQYLHVFAPCPAL